MNAPLFLSRIAGRFHPAANHQFNEYTKHLKWVTGCDDIDSREILARIYHYRNAFKLGQVLKILGIPGPFDDAIPLNIREIEHVQAAIVVRKERAMQIIFDCIGARRGSGQPKFALQQFSALELSNNPIAHKAAFRALAGLRSTTLSKRVALAH